MSTPELVILAAGLGSRFGGLKQMEPIGPSGELLLDYSLYNAHRAGFRRALFVIRREMEDDFRRLVLKRYEGKIETDLVYQELSDVPKGYAPPSGRTKPWGTAHAVFAARKVVRFPFAVINADDFYGEDVFRRLFAHLSESDEKKPEGVLVGFALKKTLSPHGPVARAVLQVDNEGFLTGITEYTKISRKGDAIFAVHLDGKKQTLPENALVSMNSWGFTPLVFSLFEKTCDRFFRNLRKEEEEEFYLPDFVEQAVASDSLKVRVYGTQEEWLGVTYREDAPKVKETLRQWTREGRYPSPLWSKLESHA